MPQSKKIVLDTNFLLIPAQFGLDIFEELKKLCSLPYKVFIVDKSLKELKKVLKEGKGADKKAASIALSLIQDKNINIIPTSTADYVDDILLSLDGIYAVCTQDRALQKKLEEKGVRIIRMRQKKYLEFKED